MGIDRRSEEPLRIVELSQPLAIAGRQLSCPIPLRVVIGCGKYAIEVSVVAAMVCDLDNMERFHRVQKPLKIALVGSDEIHAPSVSRNENSLIQETEASDIAKLIAGRYGPDFTEKREGHPSSFDNRQPVAMLAHQ